MYQDIEKLYDCLYIGKSGKDNVIFDKFGNEYAKGHMDICLVKDNTVLIGNHSENMMILINRLNGNTLRFKGTSRKINYIPGFILIEQSWNYKSQLVNAETTEIVEGSENLRIVNMYLYKNKGRDAVIAYRDSRQRYNAEYNHMIIDRETNKIKYYSIEYDFQETSKFANRTVLATSVTTNDEGFSLSSRKRSEFLRYKLGINGIIKDGAKEYEDIAKTSEIEDTDTFYTYDFIKNNYESIKMGLIDSEGMELLPAIYDNIRYVGNNNYILYKEERQALYNRYANKIIIDFNESKAIIRHDSIPLIEIIRNNGEAFIIDNNNRLFNIADIGKYLDCSYNSNNSNVIKINFGDYNKYVNNKLEPIDFLESAKDKWIKIK